MGNPTLTKILMAALVGTFLVATLFGVYTSYLSINNVTIQEPYNTAFRTISEQYSSLDSISGTISNQGSVTNILDFGKNAITGTVNVFVVGLSAIGGFFSIIPILGNIIQVIAQVIPGFGALLGLFTTLITLFIFMRYIQSVSNKFDLP